MLGKAPQVPMLLAGWALLFLVGGGVMVVGHCDFNENPSPQLLTLTSTDDFGFVNTFDNFTSGSENPF